MKQWRFKDSEYTFLQQTDPGKDTWNTECFNKKLRTISKDASPKFGLVLSTRASGVLPNRQAKDAEVHHLCLHTARRKLVWIFVGVVLANTPSREYTPFSPVSPAKSPTSHYCC